MLKKELKTGYSEVAAAAFVTALALGILPFFNVDIDTLQATNLGLCIASAVGFVLRQLHKQKGS